MGDKWIRTIKCSISVILAIVMAAVLVVPESFSVTAYAAGGQAKAAVVSTHEIKVGETVTLQATNNQSTWTTSDSKIATVTNKGAVTGISAGTATVTETTTENNGFCFFWFWNWGTKSTSTKTYTIVVKDGGSVTPEPEDPNAKRIKIGETITLSVTGSNVTWKSSDTAVATVSSKGEVTGVKAGKATITATSVTGTSGGGWFGWIWSWFGWGGSTSTVTEFKIIVSGYEKTSESETSEPENEQPTESETSEPENEQPTESETSEPETEQPADPIVDSDSDKVPDNLEELLGSSPEKDDTDGDGIDDYTEIYVIGSDPTVNDSSEDDDNDGLTNIEEIKLGINPIKMDTDLDGISDYDEINTYNSNPLETDTDLDGIKDGDELFLGTDPLVKDAIDSIEQTLDISAYDSALLEDNEAVPSISGYAGNMINKAISVSESKELCLAENRAIWGKGVEVDVKDSASKLTLTFEMDDETNSYVIAYLNDGEWVLLDTKSNNNTVSAIIEGSGTYCVMDLNVLFSMLGIDIDEYYDSVINFKAVSDVEETTGEIDEFSSEEIDKPDAEEIMDSSTEETVESSMETVEEIKESSAPEEDSKTETDSEAEVVNSENKKYGTVSLSDEVKEIGKITSSAKLANGIAAFAETGEVMGQADIVFVIDTTGSMSDEISNVANNVVSFADTLSTVYNVSVNTALIDYKDITADGTDSTKIIKNGSTSWFTSIADFKNAVASLRATGGGDGPETAIDALEVARNLNYRKSASKFIILVTDANYKKNNNYGINSMDEEINLLKANNIITSVVTSSSYKSTYQNVFETTGGIYANIYGNFSEELLKLADLIGLKVNEYSWILLSDFQYVALNNPVAVGSGDTDGDGKSDYDELKTPKRINFTSTVKQKLSDKGVPSTLIDDYFKSEGGVYLTVYPYYSNPGVNDTDYDGIGDKIDNLPKNNRFKGTYHASGDEACKQQVDYTMDYRLFFNSNTSYNSTLARTSLMMSTFIYNLGGFGYNTAIPTSEDNSLVGSLELPRILEAHGMKDVVDYKLDKDYSDDDISEVVLGHHEVEYNGTTKEVLAIIVRGTNGTIQEWSSNFDMGNTANFSDYSDWTSSSNHKGFDVASCRILKKIDSYVNSYVKNANVAYWVTGHSRGAAIANIVSANLVDSGKNVYAYTFATPNTTISSSANNAKYNCIFNFVNADDFVPTVPMNSWNFKRFGVTANVDMSGQMENEWHNLTGSSW